MDCILEKDELKLSLVLQFPDGVHVPNGQNVHTKAVDWLLA
jgi:hypothetical protein